MKSALSISAAWDQTKARFAADGGLLMTVALALIALPSALAEFVFPSRGMMNEASMGELVALLIVFVLGMIGQLALIRLALGPSVSVGEAIAHGARRAPAFLGAALILLLLLFLIAIPFGIVLTAMGVTMEGGAPQPTGAATLVLLLFFVLIIFFSTRLMVMSAVASMEGTGPIAMMRRSWTLTTGHFGRLIGFLLLFLIAALIAIMAVGMLVRVLVTAVVGTPETHSAGALIIALVVSLATAAVTAVFVVMIARIYAQLAGRDAAVSVPSSGT